MDKFEHFWVKKGNTHPRVSEIITTYMGGYVEARGGGEAFTV